MNELLINYLNKQGFITIKIDNKSLGSKNKENVYCSIAQDYRRFIYLEWECELNYPSIKVYVCDNKSTNETREFIGYPYAGTIKCFKNGFKECYIKKYGKIRYYFRPICRPFFKFLTVKETKYLFNK